MLAHNRTHSPTAVGWPYAGLRHNLKLEQCSTRDKEKGKELAALSAQLQSGYSRGVQWRTGQRQLGSGANEPKQMA